MPGGVSVLGGGSAGKSGAPLLKVPSALPVAGMDWKPGSWRRRTALLTKEATERTETKWCNIVTRRYRYEEEEGQKVMDSC